jgi:hypothetical protein
MPMTVEDSGDAAKTGDESCVKTSYARNTSAWLVNTVSRTETYSVPCATTPVIPDDVVSDITTAYDGQAVGVAPTKGEITASYRVASYGPLDKLPVYQKVIRSHLRQAGPPAHRDRRPGPHGRNHLRPRRHRLRPADVQDLDRPQAVHLHHRGGPGLGHGH